MNKEKPSGLSQVHASVFKKPSVVANYRNRPAYTDELFKVLQSISCDQPNVLDIGCGTGDLSLGLANFAKQVDAVDFSQGMISEAQKRDSSHKIQWHYSTFEDFEPPLSTYDLVTAAQSLHWMDWKVAFPKIKSLLPRGQFLAIVTRGYLSNDWWNDDLLRIIKKYSTNKDYEPYRLVEEISQRFFFKVEGRVKTKALPFSQSIFDLILAFQSRNGLAEESMGKPASMNFRDEMMRFLKPYAKNGVMELGTYSSVTWGTCI